MEDNPLFLANCDIPGQLLVSHVLTHENYSSWSAEMRVALSVRNKFFMVDGSYPEPKNDQILHQDWTRCNNIVISWLLNAISKEIQLTVAYYKTAADIWYDLKVRYQILNGPRRMQIKRDLSNLSQDSDSIAQYYSKVKALLEETREQRPSFSCTCYGLRPFTEYLEGENALQFLMGLNENFHQIRDNILMIEPIPSIAHVYAMLVQEEKKLQHEKHGKDSLSLHQGPLVPAAKNRGVWSITMSPKKFISLLFVLIALFSKLYFGGDPTVHTDLPSCTSVSPIGVPQQVIDINKNFSGPLINVTTNNHVIVNVYNELDEELLITWSVPVLHPSLNFQRASGGFGPLVINNRDIIPIPFAEPDGDVFFLIGDWYTQNHTALRATLDSGKDLGILDGVLINGKGPYQYNTALVPTCIEYETITVDPGRTYRIRVHNVGISTSLNFRIQSHNLLLAETEDYYTSQTNFTNFDIHAGQSYSFLLSTDQNASTDYYIVASARFVNESLWQKATGVAILHYSNSKGPATGSLPPPPDDIFTQNHTVCNW